MVAFERYRNGSPHRAPSGKGEFISTPKGSRVGTMSLIAVATFLCRIDAGSKA